MAEAIPGETFHREGGVVYDAPLDWAVYKRGAQMARVVYEATHANAAETGDRAGHGRNEATWVFAEEPGIAEGLCASPLDLFIDARLAPHAAIGLHEHTTTEEVYYMLEGSLVVTTLAADGRESTSELLVGDAHLIRVGQSHFAVAGPDGARFVTVAVRVP
ncbi:MAG: hypothetical protein JWM80_5372 [Cyanobacteria bacterium RYN_339]|nr:hypothetical protein [Cyanobacteria bacterium RYN_339]